MAIKDRAITTMEEGGFCIPFSKYDLLKLKNIGLFNLKCVSTYFQGDDINTLILAFQRLKEI